MFTQYAGPGSLPGLFQTSCWQILRSADFAIEIKVSRGKVDIVGAFLSQALPISTTMDPSSVSSSERPTDNSEIQFRYSVPFIFPYFLGIIKGYGGEVKIRFTFPLSKDAFFEFKKSSIVHR
jgi:hypothetical protein